MVRLLMLLSFLTLALAGCGRERDQEGRRPSSFGRNGSQLIYGFTGRNDNGQPCVTGRFVFSTVEEYCSALQDEVRNMGCARQARRRTYEITCQ